MDYRIGGVEGWHSRTKLGGEFLRAPIVVDRVEAWGIAESSDSVTILGWRQPDSGGNLPYSSHAGNQGVPEGGNFLFEDGHVTWYRQPTIALAAKAKLEPSTYLHFYKIPIENP